MFPRQKVLIVEDNADVRRLYAIGLNQHGFEVKLAANGAEALDRIASERPDLILLDLMMPVMDGWELIQRINPTDQQRRSCRQTDSPGLPLLARLNGYNHLQDGPGVLLRPGVR